jgi:hypothetical protein
VHPDRVCEVGSACAQRGPAAALCHRFAFGESAQPDQRDDPDVGPIGERRGVRVGGDCDGLVEQRDGAAGVADRRLSPRAADEDFDA